MGYLASLGGFPALLGFSFFSLDTDPLPGLAAGAVAGLFLPTYLSSAFSVPFFFLYSVISLSYLSFPLWD